MPCRFDHSWQRAAVKAPSRIASRKLGHAALPASRAASVSRSCTEAGTTATASQVPSASTRATRLRPSTFLAASYPRGPRTGMHLTACVSMMLRRGLALRPIARRRRRGTSSSKRSNSPSSSHLRNQPYTVRQGGPPGGSARHGPPMRRCQAIARTTAPYGVARPLRGGSARSSHRAIWPTACSDTISFRRASCRARCASVHIVPLNQTTIVTAGSDRDQAHRPTQTGSELTEAFAAVFARHSLFQDALAASTDGALFVPEAGNGGVSGGWLDPSRPSIPAGDLPAVFAAPALLAAGAGFVHVEDLPQLCPTV